MTKTEAAPLWQRLSKRARTGNDRERGLYVAARRVLAPASSAARSLAARRSDPGGLTIPDELGYAIHAPDRFPETREIVEAARARLEAIDPDDVRKRGKPFMTPILDQSTLTRESPFVRFALRDDVLRAVASYLRVAPILSSIDVYYSRAVDRELMSSQLLHCDGDDTRQIKIFVLCTEVDATKGPLMVMDTETSRRLRRSVGYEYRNRVTDEDARAILGDVQLTPVLGAPGTTCFVDTSRCFHYGSRVDSHDEGRLVTIVQYLTPYSFMLPRDASRAAPYRHLGDGSSGRLERLALGAG